MRALQALEEGAAGGTREKTMGASKRATAIPEASTMRSDRRLIRKITVVANQ
jgi:hypothetical protein